MQSALGNSCAFIDIDSDFLQERAIELLPPAGVVLELMLDDVPDKATLARCHYLRDRGYTLALARYRGIDDRSRPVLPMLQVIKIDIDTASESELRDLAGSLRHLPLKLLAQGVASRAQMECCRRLGFELFQGRYFAQAEVVSGRRLSASQAALIRLINLVGRDVDTIVIEDAFKHEPALTLNLLRVVNAVGHRGGGLAQPVTSLRHAITLFGRRQLQRWLSAASAWHRMAARPTRPLAAAAGRRPARTDDGAAGPGRARQRPQTRRPGLHHRHPVDDAGSARSADRRDPRTDCRRAPRCATRYASTKVCWAPSWRCSSASTATTPRAATACCPCSPAPLTVIR
jgi:hypothetical protein